MKHTGLTFLIATLLLLSGVVFAAGTGLQWSSSYENTPANTDPVSEADDRMQDMKINNRYRLEVEHWFGSIGSPPGTDDNGLHRVGSARAFVQAAAPTTLSDSVGDYDSVNNTRFDITDLNDSASNSGGAIADDVGHGRLWVDTDDNKMYYYLGVAGDDNGAWTEITAQHDNTIEFDDQILAGSANLVYNGSFEATDGTGLTTATAVPAGWAAIDAATFTYGTTTDPDLVWGDGVYAIVTDVDGSDGMSIVLNNLAASKVFKVIARVAEEDASDVCTLSTSGADTDMTPDASSGTTWETLSGTFTTAAALDDVTISLVSTAAGDICNWDHVAVYEVGDVTTDRDEVPVPAVWVTTDTTTDSTTTTTASFVDVPGLQADVVIPAPGCVVEVTASISGENSSALTSFICQLDERTGGTKSSRQTIGHGSNNAHQREFSLTLHDVVVNPTPGTVYSYGVECADTGTAATYYCAGNGAGEDDCNIFVKTTCGGS